MHYITDLNLKICTLSLQTKQIMFSYKRCSSNIYTCDISKCTWSKHFVKTELIWSHQRSDLHTTVFHVQLKYFAENICISYWTFEWKPQWKPDEETFLRSLQVCVCLHVCMGKTRPATGPLLLFVFVLFFVVFSVPPPSLSPLCVCVCVCVYVCLCRPP